MRLSKYVVLGITALSLGTGFAVSGTTAHALQSSWKNDHWVTITKTVTVDKYKITSPVADSYIVKSYTIKRGAHYKLSHWSTNFPWALQSGKYNSGARYTFVPDENYNDASWFKAGIHEFPKYKAFHGYRILTSNAISYNTYYEPSSHSTYSDYLPTDKSKIIFMYGTHEYPTHHLWTWCKNNSYYYDYKYKNGIWHKYAVYNVKNDTYHKY